MLKTLTVLSHIAKRDEFTIDDLATSAGVSASTVNSVLRRLPDDWFVKTKIEPKRRGGQPLLFTLTDLGRQGVVERLNRLPTVDRFAPVQPPFDVPMGLLAAEETVEGLEEAPPRIRRELIRTLRDNLDWAEAELEAGSYAETATVSAGRIAAVREKIAQAPQKKSELLRSPRHLNQKGIVELARKKLEVAQRQFRYWQTQITEAHRVIPLGSSARVKTLAPHHVLVYIGYPVADLESQELAHFARWAIAGAEQMVKFKFHVWVGEFEEQRIKTALNGQSRTLKGLGNRELELLLLCVNSSADPKIAQRAIEKLVVLEGADFIRKACVLDRGHSPGVARVAHECRLTYSPNAADERHADWISKTLGASSDKSATLRSE